MLLSSVAPTGFNDFPPNDVFPLIKKAGIEKVHVVRDENNKWPADKILSVLNDHGLIAHSYHSDFGQRFDLTCDDTQKRQQALNTINEEAEFALSLGVQIFIMHPSGLEQTIPNARDNFRKTLEPLARMMENLQLTCYLENLPATYSYGSDTKKLAEDILSVRSANLGICFDTGHSNINRQNISAQLQAADGLLGFIHAHDNDGTEDKHSLPFTGTIDWNAIADTLRTMQYSDTFCLEVFASIDELERQFQTGWLDRLNEFLQQASSPVSI